MDNFLGKLMYDISQGKYFPQPSVVIKLIKNHNAQMFADITEGITDAERQTRYISVHY